MKATVAFSNSGNYWTSRYGYTSSCMGWVKDTMVSAPKNTLDSNVMYVHDKEKASNNGFYGGALQGSSFTVSFNENPSANKIYKSFSIESPDDLSIGSVHTFEVDKSSIVSSTRREIDLHDLKNFGGIMYGTVGGNIKKTRLSNSQALGKIKRRISRNSFSSHFSPAEMDAFEDLPGYNSVDAYLEIEGPPLQYSSNLGSQIILLEDLGVVTDSEGTYQVGKIRGTYKRGFFCSDLTDNYEVGEQVFVLYPEANFESAKGRFAEATINIGTQFEIYAVNVDYEMTPLDHNK